MAEWDNATSVAEFVGVLHIYIYSLRQKFNHNETRVFLVLWIIYLGFILGFSNIKKHFARFLIYDMLFKELL